MRQRSPTKPVTLQEIPRLKQVLYLCRILEISTIIITHAIELLIFLSLGDCVYFKACPALLEIYNRRPPNPQDRIFLSLSQCGYRDGQPLVCCREVVAPPAPPPPTSAPNVPVTQPPQRSPLLPKPGECGIDAENRIYGGNRTNLDEYPWMALLQYSKRK